MKTISFAQMFEYHATIQPKHTAFVIDDRSYTYEDVIGRVKPIAAYLHAHGIRHLGILASRSLEAYLGILSAHWVGAAYVPLNPTFPIFQLHHMIERAQVDAILVDSGGLSVIHSSQFNRALPIITPVVPYSDNILTIIGPAELELISTNPDPIQVSAAEEAYVIFTSGSTGDPKAIPISFGNVSHFMYIVKDRYELNANDKVAQFSKISFDVSVFDLILSWSSGATMYTVPEDILPAPAKFIRDHGITVWCSVPSIIFLMNKLKLLKPNAFPSLKYSIFCGEALTFFQAKLWQQTGPNQLIENLYGPTETTVVCMGQIYQEDMRQNNQQDNVPIGLPFPGMSAAIINDAHEFISHGHRGELVLSGRQVTSGYLGNKELNEQKFLKLTHPEYGKKRWYLTGDYCYQDHTGVFHYIGRLDNQCKILGYRVELEEIEYYLRKIHGNPETAVALVKNDNHDPMIVAAVVQPTIDLTLMKLQLKQYLPPYMIPTHIFSVDELPYNSNGKLDRKKLRVQLNNELSKPH